MTRPYQAPRGDPWNAFGYIVAGVLSYGLIGFGLDRWWGTGFMVAVGIMVGAVLGLYMTWARFKAPPDEIEASENAENAENSPTSTDPTSHPTEPQR